VSKVILPRQALWAALVASVGMLLFAATTRAETKTWNLANDFPVIKQNPAFDKYRHRVWFFSQGEAHNALNKYPELTHFFDPAEEEAACGIKDFYEFDAQKSVTETPAIWYNAGSTVERGSNRCAPSATYPAKTAFMHPGFYHDAVVRWKSYITGMVTVTGSVEPVDALVTGISWELDRGSTILVGPIEAFEDSLTSFGPITVSVVKGEFLNFAIGGDGGFDSTAVTLTITS
jgi:hypothetical protein